MDKSTLRSLLEAELIDNMEWSKHRLDEHGNRVFDSTLDSLDGVNAFWVGIDTADMWETLTDQGAEECDVKYFVESLPDTQLYHLNRRFAAVIARELTKDTTLKRYADEIKAGKLALELIRIAR